MVAAGPYIIGSEARAELARRELAVRSFPHFVRYRFAQEKRQLHWNWHLDYLGEVLTAVWARQLLRVLINMPFRSLKSETMQCWCAWMILQDDSPRSSVLSASATADLALTDSAATRDIVVSEWFRDLAPHVIIDPNMNQARKWKTVGGAKREAAGAGGQVTGKGGDHLLWDDLLKPEDANSDRVRTKTCTWLGETFRSRLNDQKEGTIVGIMQRLHELDPTGYLLDQAKIPGADQWHHVKIELEAPRPKVYAFGDFYYERKASELMHQSRIGPKQVAALKIALGVNYSGQCNQDPRKMEGNVIKWDWLHKYKGDPPKLSRKYQTWDFAVTAESLQRGDYSVCCTWGRTEDGKVYLLDVYREKINSVNLVEAILEQAELHGVKRAWGEKGVIEKTIGPFLDERLREKGQTLILEGIASTRDKVERSTGFVSMARLGNIYVPEHARWITDFKLELTAFPNGAHDDQVDACSLFAIVLDLIRTGVIVVEAADLKQADPETRNAITGEAVRARILGKPKTAKPRP